MILSYGEILVDMIGRQEGDTVVYEPHAGGAPFNVACAAASAGGDSGFVGAVGDDIMGKFLIDFAASRNLSFTDIARMGDANTTLAFVSLASDGERSFGFYRKHTADYRMSEKSLAAVERANLINVGSLMLAKPEGAAFARALIAKCRSCGKTVCFDINYRDDIFDSTAAAVRAYSEVAEKADIVKYSEDEIELITGKPWREAIAALARPNKLICVTLGKRGCAYALGERYGEAAGIKVTPVDTTGAGDAFFGALLSRLDGRDFTAMTAGELDYAFRFACAAGAIATTVRGAIDSLPTASAIESALAKAN